MQLQFLKIDDDKEEIKEQIFGEFNDHFPLELKD